MPVSWAKELMQHRRELWSFLEKSVLITVVIGGFWGRGGH